MSDARKYASECAILHDDYEISMRNHLGLLSLSILDAHTRHSKNGVLLTSQEARDIAQMLIEWADYLEGDGE